MVYRPDERDTAGGSSDRSNPHRGADFKIETSFAVLPEKILEAGLPKAGGQVRVILFPPVLGGPGIEVEAGGVLVLEVYGTADGGMALDHGAPRAVQQGKVECAGEVANILHKVNAIERRSQRSQNHASLERGDGYEGWRGAAQSAPGPRGWNTRIGHRGAIS